MPPSTILLSGGPIPLATLARLSRSPADVRLHPDAIAHMRESREAVDSVLRAGHAVYGINTGFGKLSDVRIADDELVRLQENLVRSHCCGVGEPLKADEVRVMILLRANVLAKGSSGVRVEVAEALLDLLRHDVVPVVPAQGSVGASGDLAPLAHLALALLGEGESFCQGRRVSSAEALRQSGLRPLQLQAKEGLALLNGTQAMTAVGGLALARGLRVAMLADVAGAMTLEALLGTPTAFDERIHGLRPHAGQVAVAAHLRALLGGSEIRESHRHGDLRVQDAYSLRCMPQVHGAVRDALAFAIGTLEIETGSATDNPLVLKSGDGGFDILSGGNFHGAPVAAALDFAAIALADLASISERRVDRLVNPDANEGLPPFLTTQAGVASGFMIAHVSVAALLNECRVLAHPASVDNTPTSGGKEDHVSMGMTSALKLRRIVMNAEYVTTIELIAAAQGMDYRLPLQSSAALQRAKAMVREIVPTLTDDRVLSVDIEALASHLRQGGLDELLGQVD